MNANFKMVLVSALLSMVFGLTAVKGAKQSPQFRFNPNPDNNSQPRLGIQGHMESGYGLAIDWVQRGSLAQRVGLESGDVIKAVDGQRIRSFDQYSWLLRNSGCMIRLTIEDGRTGNTVVRNVYLSDDSSPVYGAHVDHSFGRSSTRVQLNRSTPAGSQSF